MKVCTKSKNSKIACNPRINSKSKRRFIFLLIVLLPNALACIFAMNGQYCSMTHFMGDNIFIHLVFTFLNNLFPFPMNTSQNFLELKKLLKWVREKKCMACSNTSNQATKLNFDSTKHGQICVVSKTMDSNHEWNNYLFHLNSHTNFGILENTIVITTHGDELWC